jgi:anti-sigma factor RsiW
MTGPADVPDLRCVELVELLGEYLEGTLTPGRRDDLEAHLRGCRGCSAVVDQLRATVGLLGEVPSGLSYGLSSVEPDELPDDVRAALVAAFDELRGRGR